MDLKYYMLSAQQQYYLPLGRSFTLALNGQVDWGRSYGDEPFPVIKNIYGGGIGSVRGYEGGSLRPRDTTTGNRSEEHTYELQSLIRIPYAVICLLKKKTTRLRSQHRYIITQ